MLITKAPPAAPLTIDYRSRIGGQTMLDMYVVYEHPKDFPNHFVVRHWLIDGDGGKPTQRCVIGKTLAEVRSAIPTYCVRLERNPEDEPQIVESWL